MLLHYFERLPWWRRLLEWLRPVYNPEAMPFEDAGDTWYTVREAADRMGVTRQRIHQYIGDGRLTARPIGRSLVVSGNSIEQFHNKPMGRPKKSLT